MLIKALKKIKYLMKILLMTLGAFTIVYGALRLWGWYNISHIYEPKIEKAIETFIQEVIKKDYESLSDRSMFNAYEKYHAERLHLGDSYQYFEYCKEHFHHTYCIVKKEWSPPSANCLVEFKDGSRFWFTLCPANNETGSTEDYRINLLLPEECPKGCIFPD